MTTRHRIRRLKSEREQTVTKQKQIAALQEDLSKALATWRTDQQVLYPELALARISLIAEDSSDAEVPVEEQQLYLPSALAGSGILSLRLDSLARIEANLRRGQLADCVQTIRDVVKNITGLLYRKRKDDRGQAPNTRSSNAIKKAEGMRLEYISFYNQTCDRMQMIPTFCDVGDPSMYSKISVEDTYCYSTEGKRPIGSSRGREGRIFRLPIHAHPLQPSGAISTPSNEGEENQTSTPCPSK